MPRRRGFLKRITSYSWPFRKQPVYRNRRPAIPLHPVDRAHRDTPNFAGLHPATTIPIHCEVRRDEHHRQDSFHDRPNLPARIGRLLESYAIPTECSGGCWSRNVGNSWGRRDSTSAVSWAGWNPEDFVLQVRVDGRAPLLLRGFLSRCSLLVRAMALPLPQLPRAILQARSTATGRCLTERPTGAGILRIDGCSP